MSASSSQTSQASLNQKRDLHVGEMIGEFCITEREYLSEIDGYAYIFHHIPSHARLAWLACEDINMSFTIGFKTPPQDSTGVFHILEHSVLCGSNDYPVKEPFVHLLKTSMQTFLNAMTFPDKTIYPVSSTNQQDLINLTNVYLDAVFHPHIYTMPDIFKQEGWSLALEEGSDKLTYKGVVLSEMRGALSSPETMSYHKVMETLFPDSAYGYISGGDVREIPQLTYEAFLDAHTRHYTLENSYTILYGALDINQMLSVIGNHFAHAPQANADRTKAPNPLNLQAPHTASPVVFKMKTTPDNAMVSLAYTLEKMPTRTDLLALGVLIEALCGTNDAPLKKRVLAAQLADDMTASLIDDCAQPTILFQLKGTHGDVADTFEKLIEESCNDFTRQGIDRRRVSAAIAQTEFMLRERDWSSYSDGVALSVQVLSSWLYDDTRALDMLRFEEPLRILKEELSTRYLEDLLTKAICHNNFKARVTLVPSDSAEFDEEKTLANIQEQMTPEELAEIRQQTARLQELQATPDSREALKKLPQLHISDIQEGSLEPPHTLQSSPYQMIHYDIATHGIDYLYAYFDLKGVAFDDLVYVGLAQELFGKLDTDNYSADELDLAIQEELGGISCFVSTYADDFNPLQAQAKFVIGASALSEHKQSLAKLAEEISLHAHYTQYDRIYMLLTQRKQGMEQIFVTSGHAQAAAYLSSMRFASARILDEIEGIAHYRRLADILAHWQDEKEDICAKIANVAKLIFLSDDKLFSFTGAQKDYQEVAEALQGFAQNAQTSSSTLIVPELIPHKHAYSIPAEINFVAADTPHVCPDYNKRGAWNILSRVASLDYLWNEVRVKKGAYGCGLQHSSTGHTLMWSYRDPSIDETLETYANVSSWLKDWEPTKTEFEGYVVSTTSSIDAPQKPYAQARMLDTHYLKGYPNSWRKETRDQQLSCTAEAVRALAPEISSNVEDLGVVVFGSRKAIEASRISFDEVEDLIRQ